MNHNLKNWSISWQNYQNHSFKILINYLDGLLECVKRLWWRDGWVIHHLNIQDNRTLARSHNLHSCERNFFRNKGKNSACMVVPNDQKLGLFYNSTDENTAKIQEEIRFCPKFCKEDFGHLGQNIYPWSDINFPNHFHFTKNKIISKIPILGGIEVDIN